MLPMYPVRREVFAPECLATGALQWVKCWDYLQAIISGNEPCLGTKMQFKGHSSHGKLPRADYPS